MADKIVVMHDGIVEQIGAPLELYDRPANVFVATFIGSPAMNLLKGRVGADGGSVQIAGGATVAVPGLAAEPGRDVTIGVRPEHLTLGSSGVPAKVTIVEPTGADTQVSATSEAGEISAIFRERHDFKPGDAIVLEPQPGTAHVFDAQSGKRL